MIIHLKVFSLCLTIIIKIKNKREKVIKYCINRNKTTSSSIKINFNLSLTSQRK